MNLEMGAGGEEPITEMPAASRISVISSSEKELKNEGAFQLLQY